MLAQILNRDFILGQMQDIQKDLAALRLDLGSMESRLDLPPLDREIIETTHSAIGQVLEEEAKASSGQKGDFSERRSGLTPIDDFCFFSREPLVSNAQSAVEAYFLEKDSERIRGRGVEDDHTRGGRIPTITDQSIGGWQPRKSKDGRRLFNKFSVLDIRWVSCKLAEHWTLRNGPHHFVPTPQESLLVPDNLRLVLVGDWATGLPRARRVAAAIRNILEEGKRKNLEQHVMHLGDTYYSGWGAEYKRRFLPNWPVDDWEAGRIGSWALNSNHDMYSGGHGYYEVLLQDKRFHRQRGSSVFSVHNSKWQILGLDTAYVEDDLKDQVDWIKLRLNESKRKILGIVSGPKLLS